MRDFALTVFPDFRAGREVMSLGIHGIVVLIGIEGVGNFTRQLFGDGIVAAWIFGLDGGGADDDFGAEGFEEIDFFLGLLVRDGEDHFVAAYGGDERKAHAGVAARAFNDGAAGLQQSALFGVVNHGDADAVFHRAAGIGVVRFDVDLRDIGFGDDGDGAGWKNCGSGRRLRANDSDDSEYRSGFGEGGSGIDECSADTDFRYQHCGVGKDWAGAWRVFRGDTTGDEHGGSEQIDFAGDAGGD
jgi:hypothetical protein